MDNVTPGLRAREIDLEPGQESTLLAAVLHERLDAVVIPSVTPASLRRLQRSGLPCWPDRSTQAWVLDNDDAGPARDHGVWVTDRGDWLPVGSISIAEALGEAVHLVGFDRAEARYLHLEGVAAVRRMDATADSLVTSATITDQFARVLVQALATDVAQGDSIRVPTRQVSLLRELSRAGFVPGETLTSAVLLPLLDVSVEPPISRTFQLTVDDIDAFGASSGDMNPLHFDAEFAQRRGFQDRIAHGMIFAGWLSRLFGTEYPGPGTIFLSQQSSFMQPIYPGRPYDVRISSPIMNQDRGTYRLVAQVRDAAGRVAFVSYSDVLRRDG